MGCTRQYPNSLVRCVHAQSFCLGFFKPAYRFRLLQRKKCRFQFYESTPNWFGVSIKIYTSPFLFGFQTWAMIRIYFVTSSISLFLVTPCGQKFLAQHVTGMFRRRRAKTPKSKVGGEVSAGIGDGDLTNDWSTCVGETGKLEQMVQQNVMGCFVFWFGK